MQSIAILNRLSSVSGATSGMSSIFVSSLFVVFYYYYYSSNMASVSLISFNTVFFSFIWNMFLIVKRISMKSRLRRNCR